MNGPVDCFTSFTFAYLSRALVLLETVRRVHPSWRVHAMLVDEPPPGLDGAAALGGFDSVVRVADLGIPRWRSWLFKHDLVEACTAVKGPMLRRLLAGGAGAVVYLDPDIALFHPIDAVLAGLEEHSIALTPHQLAANDDPLAVQDNEIGSLRYGIFNLGFLAVRNDATGRAFADWWSAQLERACYDELGRGIFTDQKYCDLVPALFERLLVVRDPGCNVASWNLSRRRLAFDGAARLTVNGSPLKFYHFTKIGGVGDVMTERYAGANLEVYEVWNWYKRRLAARRVEGVPDGWWHFGAYADGTAIDRRERLFFRRRPDLMAAFDDPFAAGAYRAWLARERPALPEE